MKKIILTSGGTAGHIYPVLCVGESLKKNLRVKLLYVGLRNGPEKELVKKSGIDFYGIFTGKRRAYFSFANFIDLFKTLFGLIQVFFLFINFSPDVIFAKGGYVSFPVVFWAKRFKTRLILHESDIVFGRTNLWAANFAKNICLGFPIRYFTEYNNPKILFSKVVYSGIPLRKEFINAKISTHAERRNRPQILFFGGSQGASKINQLLEEILTELLGKYEIYHISGKLDYKKLKDKFRDKKNYHLYDYSENIEEIMAQSDLIVCRAGANTLAEISALGKAAILIPLPTSASNHQEINAKVYQDSNSAVVLKEKNLTSSALESIINRLIEDENLRQLLGHHAREFFVPNAVSIITDLIYEDK